MTKYIKLKNHCNYKDCLNYKIIKYKGQFIKKWYCKLHGVEKNNK